MTHTHFQIEQLRMKSLTKTIEGILVILATFLVAAFLPQLLLQYVYAGQQLMARPALLEYLPVVLFAVGLGYFVFAMITNLLRERKVAKLEKEAMAMAAMDSCCGGSCGDGGCCDHDEMHGAKAEMKFESAETKTGSIAEALKASKTKRVAKKK